jgi:hypothetical protein
MVFKLTPPATGPTWTEIELTAFAGGAGGDGPNAGLIFDGSGSLYGTTIRQPHRRSRNGFQVNATLSPLRAR